MPQWDNTNHLTEDIKAKEIEASEKAVFDFNTSKEQEKTFWWDEPTEPLYETTEETPF